MSEVLVDAYLDALKSMRERDPRLLARRAGFIAEELDSDADVGMDRLLEHLRLADANDLLTRQLGLALFEWDSRPATEEWTASTEPRTGERRARVHELLGLGTEAAKILDELMPHARDTSTIISGEFAAWYPPADLTSRSFYWDRYRSHLLEGKHWDPEAIGSLDEDTTRVLERVSDPVRTEAFSARGLVVGYVQSGKTANFTGVIAKAIDAGCRLIVVLAGTLDILREQTQRRLDMELVGMENILRGRPEDDPGLAGSHDYADDPDWVGGKFISYGFLPSTRDLPDVVRLTGRGSDYRQLHKGIIALEMEKRDKRKPLFDPVNLFACGARLAVIKKNATVLKRLVTDLKIVRKQLGEIPTLIIDDESDQASVNTTDPRKWADGQIKRTSINALLSELLTLLPRAQYIGYTATPYANVFVDPEDSANIFPKDFLLALRRPKQYMGVSDFHDLDTVLPAEDRNPATSNEEAFVRNLYGETADERRLELASAIDAFVLSGALKLFRETAGAQPGLFRHHTMLVNESHKRADHAETADEIREVWRSAGYTSGTGYARLKDLYESDFLPVCRARSEGQPFPEHFQELKDHLGAAVRKISESGAPVIIVNSDKDLAQEAIDFDKRPVWRILVGGTKLSRGFTVEGLTISYYRRRTRQAATLMQMGRWFGFRGGYKDLVRLYIGRNEPDRNMSLDLYQAFEAMVLDEEDFRAELGRYSELVDGKPQVTPRDIPPLVSQRLPWLRPEAPNKMYNAVLVVRRSPGTRVEPRAYPDNPADTAHNYHLLAPVAARANELVSLRGGPRVTFDAYAGLTPHQDLIQALAGLRWITNDYFQPDLKFLTELGPERVQDWLVIVPLHSDHRESARPLAGIGRRSVFVRSRQGRNFGAISEPRHREPAKFVAGSADSSHIDDPAIRAYAHPGRGALLLYPVVGEQHPPAIGDSLDPAHVTLAFEFYSPADACPAGSQLVQFTVRNPARAGDAIVPTQAVPDQGL
jgi:heme-degrading monooxygenase HmoA